MVVLLLAIRLEIFVVVLQTLQQITSPLWNVFKMSISILAFCKNSGRPWTDNRLWTVMLSFHIIERMVIVASISKYPTTFAENLWRMGCRSEVMPYHRNDGQYINKSVWNRRSQKWSWWQWKFTHQGLGRIKNRHFVEKGFLCRDQHISCQSSRMSIYLTARWERTGFQYSFSI